MCLGLACSSPVLLVGDCNSGFYPKGGGTVKLHVQPVRQLQAITLVDRGQFVEFRGIVFCAQLAPEVLCFLLSMASSSIASDSMCDWNCCVLCVCVDCEEDPNERAGDSARHAT